MEKTYDINPIDRSEGLTILVVDDEELGRLRLEATCKKLDSKYKLVLAKSLEEAFSVMSAKQVHVVLLDKNVGANDNDPKQNGINAIPEMLALQPHLQILMVTGSKDLQDAVQATQSGAFGYVTKDTPDALLLSHIQKAVQMASLIIEGERSRRSTVIPGTFGLVGTSAAIRKLKAQVSDVAQSERPILLLGETGTGKTTIAKLLHDHRNHYLKQKDRPFIAVNIAALSPNLVEGELFGSERGAYTGSVSSKQGLLELANSGTLFLDEIGEISPEIQKKLLTVIETGVFRRVGGTKELRSGFRLICATNKNLEKMVSEGLFREDLYLRLSTFPIEVPSLKDRAEDIPDILQSLLPRCCAENHVQVSFSDLPHDFIEHLMRNIPSGNIRGLEQQLARVLIYCPKDRKGNPILSKWKGVQSPVARKKTTDALSLEEFLNRPIDFVSPNFPGLNEFIISLEKRIINEATTKISRNKDLAKFLKLSRSATAARLQKLNISQENKEAR